MLARLVLGSVVLTGCIQQEAAISRQGLISGSAKSGGVGFSAMSATYRETGTSNVAAGITITMIDEALGDGMLSTLGVGGRYAHQLDRNGRVRAFTRASFGLGACQVITCKNLMKPPTHQYVFEAHVGVERMVFTPDLTRPQDSLSMSGELGLMYSHTNDEVLGQGDFLGVGLGLRLGFNMMAGKR